MGLSAFDYYGLVVTGPEPVRVSPGPEPGGIAGRPGRVYSRSRISSLRLGRRPGLNGEWIPGPGRWIPSAPEPVRVSPGPQPAASVSGRAPV